MIEDAFAFDVANNVPDQTLLTFTFTATVPEREAFVSTFTDIANAPSLEIAFMSIDDSEGNDNGRLDAGETVNLIYYAKNIGHAESSDAVMNLSSSSEYITVNTASVELGSITAGGFYKSFCCYAS